MRLAQPREVIRDCVEPLRPGGESIGDIAKPVDQPAPRRAGRSPPRKAAPPAPRAAAAPPPAPRPPGRARGQGPERPPSSPVTCPSRAMAGIGQQRFEPRLGHLARKPPATAPPARTCSPPGTGQTHHRLKTAQMPQHPPHVLPHQMRQPPPPDIARQHRLGGQIETRRQPPRQHQRPVLLSSITCQRLRLMRCALLVSSGLKYPGGVAATAATGAAPPAPFTAGYCRAFSTAAPWSCPAGTRTPGSP